MAEPVRLELAPGHVLTGWPSTEQIMRAHSTVPVRTFTFWHYDCSCRALAWAPTAVAERHAAELRPGPPPTRIRHSDGARCRS